MGPNLHFPFLSARLQNLADFLFLHNSSTSEHVPSALHIFPVVHGALEPHLHSPGPVSVAVQLLLVTELHVGVKTTPGHVHLSPKASASIHMGFKNVHPEFGKILFMEHSEAMPL